MNINTEYKKLKQCILKRIPKTFTSENDIIEEQEYNAIFNPINFNPYRQGGSYYPTYFRCTPRIYEGKPFEYRLTKGEETTINIWSAILRYKEYDLLADLFILGHFHDTLQSQNRRIYGRGYVFEEDDEFEFYSVGDMKQMCEKARAVLKENDYGGYNPRCKTYLTMNEGDVWGKYLDLNSKPFNNTEEYADALMDVIIESYNSLHFLILYPSKESCEYARNIQQEAVEMMFDQCMKEAEELYGKEKYEK